MASCQCVNRTVDERSFCQNRNFVWCSRKMHCYRRIQKFHHAFTLTRLLYALNALFVFALISRMTNHPQNINPDFNPVAFEDGYLRDISNAMETFDFMYTQKMAAKSIPPPEDEEGLSILIKNCLWFWNNPEQFTAEQLNASIVRSNGLWQSVHPSETEIYLYSAFYDHRPNVIFPDSAGSVQIIGVVWRRLHADVYCQYWTDHSKSPFVVKALIREIWQRAWDPRDRFYVPVLFTCPLPSSKFRSGMLVPDHISLIIEDPCSRNQAPTTFLPILAHRKTIQNQDLKSDQTKHTVVCVKGMDFLEDLSVRFVEWLELNYHVGADKVVIYTYSVHPRMQKVIDYYERTSNGRFQHVPLTLPGHAPNSPLHRSRFIHRNRQQKRRHEIVPYNDCLYRHLGTHRYVLIVDVDELVVPLKHSNWTEMLNEVKTVHQHDDDDAWTAFSISNAFFFDNLTLTDGKKPFQDDRAVPSQMHILTHDRRSKKISPPGIYGKSFMDTRNVATVFNHFPLHKHRRRSDAILKSTHYVDPNLARKNHYKSVCPVESRDECPDLYGRTVKDDSALRYASDVMPKIRLALKAIGIEPATTTPPPQ